MCCGCAPRSTSAYEYSHPYKPENNVGCGCGRSIDCDTPTRAVEGTPRWTWEQIYGKLVTNFIKSADANGHTHYIIERVSCPVTTISHKKVECCSTSYRFVR
jgi:hypothetical protein